MLKKVLLYSVAALLTGFTVVNSQTMYTAREHYETVEAEVITNHGNQVRLVLVMSLPYLGQITVDQDVRSGKTDTWLYGFYSPEEGLMVTGVASANLSLGSYIGEVGVDNWPENGDTTRFLGNWVDSDEAAARWVENGLQSFYDSHEHISFEGMVLAYGPDHELQWSAVATDGIDSLTCSVNAVSLELIECASTTLIHNLNTAREFTLSEAYPNPVAAGSFSQIDLNINAPTELTLAVYDAQGREMGILAKQHVDPQTLHITIPAELLPRSGVYFIHAVSSTGMISKKLVVTK